VASVVQLPACTGGPAENSFGRPSGTSAIAFDRPRASLIRQRVGYRPTAAVPSAQGILELQERMPCSYLHEHLGVDRRCGWDRPCRSALPWAGQSSGFESNLTAFTRYIGIDYSGATTASRFRCGISRSISSDPSAIGQTDGDHTYVRDSLSGNGATRTGSPRWRRLTEERVRAKSAFHFDVPGSVAKSTHARLPWRFIRQRLGARVHSSRPSAPAPPAGEAFGRCLR